MSSSRFLMTPARVSFIIISAFAVLINIVFQLVLHALPPLPASWGSILETAVVAACLIPLGIFFYLRPLQAARKRLFDDEMHYRIVSELTTTFVFRLGVGKSGAISVQFLSANFYSFAGGARAVRSFESLVEHIHPDDRGALIEKLKTILADPRTLETECRAFVGEQHEIRWLKLHGRSEWDPREGRVTSVVGAATDVTERRRAEEQQARAQNLLEVSQRLAHIGSWEYDLPTGSLSWSDEMYRIAGLPVGAPIDRETIDSFFPPDELTRSRKNLSALLEESPYSTDYMVKLRNGSFRSIHNEGEVVRDGTGRAIRLVGTTQDVTERKRAEEAMRESEEKFRSIIEQSADGVVVADERGTIVEWNRAQEEITGLLRSDVIGRAAWDVKGMTLPEEPGKAERVARMRANVLSLLREGTGPGTRTRGENAIARRDGTTRIVSEHIFLTRKDAGSMIVSVVTDVTDARRAQEEKVLVEQYLQQAQRLDSLGVLAGGIAHDFNNILTGIFGYMDMAREETRNDGAAESLSQAMESMERAKALTQQLLTFSKGGAPVRNPVRMGPLIRDTCRFASSGSNVKCNVSLEDGLRNCSVDRNQIGQVIQNLMINAIQAMPMGGTIDVTAANATLREGDQPTLAHGEYVLITITDQGTGIPPQMLPRIFDPFFTTKPKGHGLGLAISHSIISRHEGSIGVRSELGRGTTFEIRLPASDGAGREPASGVPVRHEGTGRILVMDDEEPVRTLLARMLASFGYTVTTKENGAETLAAFTDGARLHRPFAAVILDLTVPGAMGGSEVAEQIRKVDKDTPLFVASGYADNPVMASPGRYGFNASLCKPFRSSDLMEILEKHVQRSPA